MTRDQHLEFCRRCTNRKFDAQQGFICNLTGRIADFDPTCANFSVDESVKIEQSSLAEVPNFQRVADLADEAKTKLRHQQDVVYAIVGGGAAALVGALLWAVVTVATNYQIGFMAIGVGLIVGFAVQFYGAGIDQHFGFIGATFALLGCLLGNVFSQVGFYANQESLGYFETLTLLNIDSIILIISETFSPIDLLFYGIAAYEGYKFAFRPITEELVMAISNGKSAPLPFAKLRVPTVVGLILVIGTLFFFVQQGSSGVRTFYYESGNERTRGEMVNGKENGPWESWWENGNLLYQGTYENGIPIGEWKFYDEEGNLSRTTNFQNNLQHGGFTEYLATGAVSGKGEYVHGRLHGPFTYFYNNGQVSQKGYYFLDNLDSTYEAFYESGATSTKGMYTQGVQTGAWSYWNTDGIKTREYFYNNQGEPKILNTWSDKGVPEVVNGQGLFKVMTEEGSVLEKGNIVNGYRAGRWFKYDNDGSLLEESEYKDNIAHIINLFDVNGAPVVSNGEGYVKDSSLDGEYLLVSGLITKGLRSGLWRSLSAYDNSVVQEFNYENGKLEGEQTYYYPGGSVYFKGKCKEGERTGQWIWYYENGQPESKVYFVAGKKEGEQLFYADEGTLLRTEIYRAGKYIETIVPK
jgi:antitoxin component YwqK of YwqJK toxin-antitoxin module